MCYRRRVIGQAISVFITRSVSGMRGTDAKFCSLPALLHMCERYVTGDVLLDELILLALFERCVFHRLPNLSCVNDVL